MRGRATRFELAIFAIMALVFSGAPGSLYVKLYAYNPPAPALVIMLPIMVFMLGNIIIRFRQTLSGGFAAWPWLGIAILALLSWEWSISPTDTLREAIILLIGVVYLAMIAALADWRDIVSRLWWVGIGLLGLTYGLFLAVPEIGRMQDVYEGALSGPWYEKNATGQFFVWMGVVSIAMAAIKPARIPFAVLTWLLCLLGVVLTQSATSLLALLGATSVAGWVFLMRRATPITIPVIAITLITAGPLLVFLFGQNQSAFELLGRSSSLTGRVPIWDALRDYALFERPLFGHGYEAYWSEAYTYGRREFVFDQLGFQARHAHNTLIEMRLALGWAGAALLSAAALQTLIFSILKIRVSSGVYVAIPFAVAAILVALVETSLLSVANWGGLLFVLILAKMTLSATETDRRRGWSDFLDQISRRPDSGYQPLKAR